MTVSHARNRWHPVDAVRERVPPSVRHDRSCGSLVLAFGQVARIRTRAHAEPRQRFRPPGPVPGFVRSPARITRRSRAGRPRRALERRPVEIRPDRETFDALQEVDAAKWRREVIEHEELFIDLHDHLPSEMVYERELLICRL